MNAFVISHSSKCICCLSPLCSSTDLASHYLHYKSTCPKQNVTAELKAQRKCWQQLHHGAALQTQDTQLNSFL